jgi:hypothetical protein
MLEQHKVTSTGNNPQYNNNLKVGTTQGYQYWK